MKNILLQLACLFSLAISAVQAQSTPFFFQSLSQQPYADLPASAQALNKGALWDGDSVFPVSLGFAFTFDNQVFTSVDVQARGVQFVGKDYRAIHVYFSPFGSNLIQDRGIANATGSMSPISYAVTGAAGSRIGKIEWKNAGPHQITSTPPDPTHFVSCQLWLFEQDGRMEIHFGPSLTTPTTFQNNNIFVKTFSGNGLSVTPTGDANSPSYTVEDCRIPCYNSITGTPALGMVYIFTPNSSSVTATRAGALLAFSVYPIPARRHLTLDLQGAPATELRGQLLDTHGRVAHSFHLSRVQTAVPITVSLPALAAGLYVLQVHSSDGRQQIKRLLVEE
jgi:hypothetical protein